jgi:hypothetical protein
MLLPSLLGYARLYRVLMSTAWFAVIKAHFTRNLHSSADLALVVLRSCRERPRGRAAEQREELAPFHCPIPPVLPTERIAHLDVAGAAALRDFSPAYLADGQSRRIRTFATLLACPLCLQ